MRVVPVGVVLLLITAPAAFMAGWRFARRRPVSGWLLTALSIAVAVLLPGVVAWGVLVVSFVLGQVLGRSSFLTGNLGQQRAVDVRR